MSKEVGEMVRSRDVVQAEGSARTEGARRATGVPADGAAAGAGSLAPQPIGPFGTHRGPPARETDPDLPVAVPRILARELTHDRQGRRTRAPTIFFA